MDGNRDGRRLDSISEDFDIEPLKNWKIKITHTESGLTRSRKGLTRSRRWKNEENEKRKKKKRLDEEGGRIKSSGRIAPRYHKQATITMELLFPN